MRRVVVTGMGLVTPLANGVEASWKRLIAGENGFKKIDNFETDDISCKIAAYVPTEGENAFNIDDVMDKKDQRKMDKFIHFGVAAAAEAIEMSGIKDIIPAEAERIGVMIGSGIGGLPEIERTVTMMNERGAKRVSPFFIPSCLINLASGHVSIRHGLKGPNHSVVTACSSGAHAIGDAGRLISFGDADVMVAGSAESTICRTGMAGFAAARALSTSYNDTPSKGSRPWDKGRDGFVMGEGAGIVVLEEYEHAKARGATIYGELMGYGLSGDAHHITAPAANGDGGFRAMQSALRNAGLTTGEVDYINAHGTSTPLGDEIELGAVKRLFGEDAYKLSMSSTKSAIGHLLGGAGSVEAIFSILAMRDQIAPPTLNLEDPSEGCDIDLVPLAAKKREINTVLSNSFGFGGTNASVVMRKI